MSQELDIECLECSATFTIKHDLNTSRYGLSNCPFCGGDEIDMEYDENEDWD